MLSHRRQTHVFQKRFSQLGNTCLAFGELDQHRSSSGIRECCKSLAKRILHRTIPYYTCWLINSLVNYSTAAIVSRKVIPRNKTLPFGVLPDEAIVPYTRWPIPNNAMIRRILLLLPRT